MADPRVKKLAKIIVDDALKVRKGENVQISSTDKARELVMEVYKQVVKRGAYPITSIGLRGMAKIFYENASKEQLRHFPNLTWYVIRKTDKYVGIDTESNTTELAHINPKKLEERSKIVKKIGNYIANERKKIWRVSTAYPVEESAKAAGMSLSKYKSFVFNAANQNWKKEVINLKKIKKVFEKGSKVRIVGEDTDLTLGIKGRKFVVDAETLENIPAGEIFSAPLETKTEGRIRFTYPSERNDRLVKNIYLEFRKGKVVKASASENENVLKEALKLKGAKIVGELGIGCNYKINKFTQNLLFDEKIGGTIHLALGMSYKECRGKNQNAAIHWDIVKDLRKGGKIYIDGKLVQKNGKWLI